MNCGNWVVLVILLGLHTELTAAESLWSFAPEESMHISVGPRGRYFITDHHAPLRKPHVRSVWDFRTGKLLSHWQDYHESGMNADETSAVITNDGKYFVSLGNLMHPDRNFIGEVRVWGLPSGTLVLKKELGHRLYSGSVFLSANGEHAFVSHAMAGVYRVTLATGQLKKATDNEYPDRLFFLRRTGQVIAHSSGMPVFKTLADYLRGNDPLTNLEKERDPDGTGFLSESEIVSADGRWFATEHKVLDKGKYSAHLRVYDLTTFRRVATVPTGVKDLHPLRISPDGTHVASCAHHSLDHPKENKNLVVYNVRKKTLRFLGEGHPRFFCFTPGGAMVIRDSGQPIRYVDPETGQVLSVPLADKWRTPIVNSPK